MNSLQYLCAYGPMVTILCLVTPAAARTPRRAGLLGVLQLKDHHTNEVGNGTARLNTTNTGQNISSNMNDTLHAASSSRQATSVKVITASSHPGATNSSLRTAANMNNSVNFAANRSVKIDANFNSTSNFTNTLSKRRLGKKRSCGSNALEVSPDLYTSIVQQSTHVEYLCKCLKTDVTENMYLPDSTTRIQIGKTGPQEGIEGSFAKQRLCRSIDYLSHFVNEDLCSYWVAPSDMMSMCQQYLAKL